MPQKAQPRRRPGRPPAPIVEFPDPLWEAHDTPEAFHEALDFHMRRHGDNVWRLFRALKAKGALIDRTTITSWRNGAKAPRTVATLRALDLIEDRYRLDRGELRKLLPRGRAISGHGPSKTPHALSRRLAWHLPDDFGRRSSVEQTEILAWVRENILSGGTAYRRYQSEVCKTRFAIRFEAVPISPGAGHPHCAPASLAEEMADLLHFKTATLTDAGYQRSGVWNTETASQRVEHLGLMLGALCASPDGEVRGAGAPLEDVSLGHLVFPGVWDWYLGWRERRRGFFTGWEADMLLLAAAFTRERTGWLRQTPRLADNLVPLKNLVSETELAVVRADWGAACDRMNQHALNRAREVQRVARVHRDPFEPLLPVLEAASPLEAYRRITEEILRLMPDARRYPLQAAEATRSFLMLRFGLHLGLRQKNLRELLVRRRGEPATPERDLERLKRGELRWSTGEQGWEVFIPCAAFKNSNSAYFSRRPFRLLLPDLGDLYRWIDTYLERERAVLLKGAPDPGVFFVKTVKRSSRDAAFTQTAFYEAWRLTIQRYGIYNPWTGRGAIAGLLAHGPHSVRDVLATHVLKQTGSYEQASYAIQDTPATVAQHYGRFLPQDKAAIAARLLNKAWIEPLTQSDRPLPRDRGGIGRPTPPDPTTISMARPGSGIGAPGRSRT
ncbi:MAG: hypothetical protein ACI8U3_002816 [Brevundimonas sp.]|jgi:hypothetical protein